MVATISPEPRLQFFANDGSFLVGGKLYTYAAGTTTPLATYTTSTGLIANTNPIILDSRGEASVWFGSSKYKFVLKTAADVEIWSQDQLQGYANADGSNAYGTWPISITGNAATATVATSVTPGAAVTSITGAGLYGFTLTGGPITSSGTLTVTPPAPSTAGNVLTSNGTNWVSQAFAGGGQYKDQLFIASGTWTCPSGVTSVKATVIGGGSGSSSSGGTGNGNGAPGGIAIGFCTVVPGTAYTVTIGLGTAGTTAGINSSAAGTSSFSTFLTATGGSGTTSSGTVNGIGGTGTGGTLLNITGSTIGAAYAPVPFKLTQSILNNSNASAGGAAQTFTVTPTNGNLGAGARGYDFGDVVGSGGTSGIVYLEWVGA